jgi:hypothetical protein
MKKTRSKKYRDTVPLSKGIISKTLTKISTPYDFADKDRIIDDS